MVENLKLILKSPVLAYFQIKNMSTPLSHSLASTEAVAGLDDSVFSPVQVNYVLYEQQQSRSVSPESYYDDEIEDDVDTSEEEEEEVPVSAFYEANGL